MLHPINEFQSVYPNTTSETTSKAKQSSAKQENTTKVFFKVFNFTQGAVKKVWGRGNFTSEGKFTHASQHVWYTPVFSLLGKNKKELQEEVGLMDKIKQKIAQIGGNIDHLAVKAQVLAKGINNKYTVQVERADCDFEKKIVSPDTTLTDRIRFGGHFISGLMNLHKADFVYGDMKPENALIFGDTLKISDFGKTKAIEPDQTLPYKGNTRFAPPEGVLSKKGDVYSAALVLIRVFEEEIKKNEKNNSRTSLHPIQSDNFEKKAVSKLRGVERYVVENKNFLGSNPGCSLTSLQHRMKMGKLTNQEKMAQQGSIHDYIDALQKELSSTDLNEKAASLAELLKEMTLSDPATRPDMDAVVKKYQEIFES